MLPHSDTLFWFQANQSLFLLHNAACLAEMQPYTKLIVFGFDQTGALTHDLPQHANHYTTLAVNY